GQGGSGDVVLGGSETAAHDHRIAAGQGELERAHDPVQVVADLGLEERVDPGEGELLADPGRVRIDDLAEQQLGPDGYHLASHGRQRTGRTPPSGDARQASAVGWVERVPRVVAAARPSRRYCAPVITVRT